MLQITGTENEIKDLCLAISISNEYCPFMQSSVVQKCNGIYCQTMDQVLSCGLKYKIIKIIND